MMRVSASLIRAIRFRSSSVDGSLGSGTSAMKAEYISERQFWPLCT